MKTTRVLSPYVWKMLLTFGSGLFVLVAWLLLAPATPFVAGSLYYVGATGDSTTTTNCTLAANTTCTLRGAISVATSGTDTITFNSSGSGPIMLSGSTLTLGANVTITGPTSGTGVIVDGNSSVTVFTVSSGKTVSLSNLTIQHGNGGIFNNGILTVTNSTITANSTSSRGGGIFNGGASATLSVTNSTISGNSAATGGGGICNNAGGSTVTVRNSTITGNSATGSGGGMLIFSGGVTITNTIVAGNTATSQGPDIQGTVTSGGHNLIGNTSNTTISGGSGDILNVAAQLGS